MEPGAGGGFWPGPLAWTVATAALTAGVTGRGRSPGLDAAQSGDPCDYGRPDSSLLHCFAAHAFSDSASTLASVNLGFNALFVCGYALSYAACGRLRPNEREQLRQSVLDFALIKLVFIPIIIEPALEDFAAWLAWFAVTGQLKVLATLARERIKFLGSALPGSVDRRGCARVVGLLVAITVAMAGWASCVCIGLAGEIGSQLVLIMLFDCLTIALELAKAAVECSAHVHERIGDDACGVSFERCSTNKYYALFALDTTASVSRLAHYGQVWMMHGVSFSLVDLILFILARHCATNLCESTSAMLSYRNTMRTLDTLFPTVDGGQPAGTDGGTEDAHDDTCVICHEIMNRMKQLPCGHCFHGACLRGWLERGSSTCPTCRAAVVSGNPASQAGGRPAQTVVPAAAAAVAGLQAATGRPLGAFDGVGNAGGGVDTRPSWPWLLDWLPSLSIERERTGNADAPAALTGVHAVEVGDATAGFADGWLALLGLDLSTVRAWLPVLTVEIRTRPTTHDDAVAATTIAAQNEENRDEQTARRQQVAMMQQAIQLQHHQETMMQQQHQQQQHRMQQQTGERSASATTRRLRPLGWSAAVAGGGSATVGNAEELESSSR